MFLILGDSGSGKSFFGQTLIKRKSEEYQFGERIPLFISLPSLRNPKINLMQETLFTNGFTQEEIEQLCKTQKFLLFLDAYNETMVLIIFIRPINWKVGTPKLL